MKIRTALLLPLICILIASVLISGISVSSIEAKSKYNLSVKFTDYCCRYGKQGQKITVTVKNTETNEKLAKKTFKFKDVLKRGSKVSLRFDRKDSRTGDNILVRGEAGPPAGGSDTEFFKFDVNKNKYNVIVELSEVGCDLPGFTCD